MSSKKQLNGSLHFRDELKSEPEIQTINNDFSWNNALFRIMNCYLVRGTVVRNKNSTIC